MRSIGCFVSCAGGLYKALENGESLGVNTIMMHPSPPQRWNSKPFEDIQIELFNNKFKDSSVSEVYMHGIYLINLANPDKQKFHLSKMSLYYYLQLAINIKAEGVMFHTGSLKDTNAEEGFERVAYGLNWIFDKLEEEGFDLNYATKNSQKSTPRLMLECAAGSGSVIGDKFEDLATIYSMISEKHKSKLGFCLDTQHMFASGYDIKNNLENVISEIDSNLKLEKVKCIHFNDSKTEFGSNKDRHENIGKGLIGEESMKNFLNHPKLKTIAFVLETPAMKDLATAKVETTILKNWAE